MQSRALVRPLLSKLAALAFINFVATSAFAGPQPLGEPFQVSTVPLTLPADTYLVDAYHVDVAMGPTGDFVAVWDIYSFLTSAVVARYFGADGKPLGPEIVISTPGMESYAPSIAWSPLAGYVVVWKEYSDAALLATNSTLGTNVMFRRLSPVGTPIEPAPLTANEATFAGDGQPRMAVRDNGAFVIVWDGGYVPNVLTGPSSSHVYARRFNAAGVAITHEFGVADREAPSPRDPDVAILGDGGFMVAWWQSYGGVDADGNPVSGGVYGRRYNRQGFAIDPVQRKLFDRAFYPRVATNLRGEGVLTWFDGRINAARIDPLGQLIDTSPFFAATAEPLQLDPAVDGIGRMTFAWAGNSSGVWSRRFGSDAVPREDAFRVDDLPPWPAQNWSYQSATAGAPDGRFVAVWTDYRNGVQTIRGRRYAAQ